MPTDTDTTSTDDTSTDTTATDDMSTATGDATTNSEPDTLAEIAAMAQELGITPGQLKGRLDASKKWEARSKKADADLEAARIAALSETEQAIENARREGKAEAAKETALELAAARLEAAGVPAEKVADLNLTGLLDDNGKVDPDKVSAFAARHKVAATPPPPGGADGGPQGGDPSKPKQLTRADMAGMTSDQIVEAKANGQFNDLLGIT